MKRNIDVFAWLLVTAAAAAAHGGGLRASQDGQLAPGAASADMFPEAIPGVLESEARESKSHLAGEDLVTEEGALSLMSFLEVTAQAGKNATMLNKGHDRGVAEAPQADKNETRKERRVEMEGVTEAKSEVVYDQKRAFMAACLRHVEALIQRLDQSYTDVHLGGVLRDQCSLEGQFPVAQSDGFKDKHACEEFADLLVEARDENLKDGTINGYTLFCSRMHEHMYGRLEEAPTKKAEPKEQDQRGYHEFWMIPVLFVVVFVCALGGMIFYLTRNPSTPPSSAV